MKLSDDESLFAWESNSILFTGLLATSPSYFQDSSDIIRVRNYIPRPPYTMTSKGLELYAQLFSDDEKQVESLASRSRYLCPLNCVREGDQSRLIAPLLLYWTPDKWYEQNFMRDGFDTLSSLRIDDIFPEGRCNQTWCGTIFVQQQQASLLSLAQSRTQCTVRMNIQQILSHGFTITGRYLADQDLGYWAKDTKDGPVLKLHNSAALIRFSKPGSSILVPIDCNRAGRAYLGLISCSELSATPANVDDLLKYLAPTGGGKEPYLASHLIRRTFSLDIDRISSRIVQNQGKVVAACRRKYPVRCFYDVELTIEH